MLQYLHIENIAVIEQANIEFSNGFNVMTGETGAGKSIIIDALFAILGERTSRELIRHGCDKAVVSASFIDIGKEAEKKLLELGYSLEDNSEVIIQRILFADGRGQVKINSQPANVSTLKEIGKLLINIHGQHDNQNLLNPEKHIAFIDAFAENEVERTAYIEAFNKFRDVSKKYNAIIADEEEKTTRANLLRYQIDEIEKSNVRIGEINDLKEKILIYQQSEKIITALREAFFAIGGDDEPDNLCAVDLLKNAIRSLGGILDVYADTKKVYEAINSLALDLEGISSDISGMIDEVNLNPEDFINAQNRLDTLRDLMLKYGDTEEQILEFLSNAKTEFSSIVQDEKLRVELENLLEPTQQALIDAGQKLTKSREIAAKSICSKICEELAFLDFNGAEFSAEIKNGKYTKNGCDYTEFLISANVGEIAKPLVKVASGGELSRIMLAIRSVLSLKDDVETLIFDEIDTGISGQAAHKVASKLYDVAKNRQVICVTHLAQIAASADRHLFISKSVKNNKTYTEVTPLDNSGRIKEVARIMSGGEYTENLLKTAEELISLMKK
ncbi:MAG: DNA repair protein RecN [Ruminococcaceae bacterium]|nr:DNA repair protein RecN [Oscillospiraceae bacterium]